MTEVKKSLKRLGFYTLLLAVNSILYAEIIPNRLLTENSSSIYLLV